MKYILSIITSLTFFLFGLSQHSYSWSEPGSIWTYEFSGQRIESGFSVPGSFKRTITKSGDSTNISADSNFYYHQFSFDHAPMQNGVTFLYSYSLQSNYEFAMYNNVIYFKQPEFTHDTIHLIPADDTLVNFNASIGDTWQFHDPFIDPLFIYDHFTSGITTVVDTGSRVINAEMLKWVYVNYTVTDENMNLTTITYGDTIFEKIGPKRNMIPSEYFYGFDTQSNGGSLLACYSDDNFAEYIAIENICDFYLGNGMIENDLVLFSPNPVLTTIKIHDLIDSKIFIYDMSGKLVLETQEHTSEIYLGALNAGIYLFKTINNGQPVSSLIVKN